MDEYRTVVGVDGCPARWLCFHVDLSSGKTTVKILASITELCAQSDQTRLIAIDIPIGLPAKGARACDIAARKLLGKPRSSSVFPAPVRASLPAKTYEEAGMLSLRAHGKSLSRQAFELIPKIREVDGLMTPELQASIFEVHPEVSFWALNGRRPLRYQKYKKRRQGRTPRAAATLFSGNSRPRSRIGQAKIRSARLARRSGGSVDSRSRCERCRTATI